MDQNKIFPQGRVRETGTMLFLSLFLLLLAFFILLNALSTFEEVRSRKVLSSVASTFQTRVLPDTTAEILISTLGPVPEPEEITDELERLWVTAVPIAKVEILKPGRTLQVTMKMTDVFVGGEAAVRADRTDLVRATANALAARLEGFSIQARITLGAESLRGLKTRYEAVADAAPAPETLDPDDPEADIVQRVLVNADYLPFIRTTLLARALIDGGAPANGISAGIVEGSQDRFRMRFDILPVDRAYVTFTVPAETPALETPAGILR